MPLQIPQLQPVVIGACRSTDIWISIDFAGVETGDPEERSYFGHSTLDVRHPMLDVYC